MTVVLWGCVLLAVGAAREQGGKGSSCLWVDRGDRPEWVRVEAFCRGSQSPL